MKTFLTVIVVALVAVPLGLWAFMTYMTGWPNRHALDLATRDAQIEALGDAGIFRHTLNDQKFATPDAISRRLDRIFSRGHSRLLAQPRVVGGKVGVSVIASGHRYARDWAHYVTRTVIICFRMTGHVESRDIRVADISCPPSAELPGRFWIDGDAVKVEFPRAELD